MSFGTVDQHSGGQEGARQIAVRAALRTLGVVLILSAGAAVVSLATWNVDDPSFSYVTDAPARNWLGGGGAAFADLAMQFLGLASLALILPAAIWGWRLVGGAHLRRPVRRLALWILGMASLGAALSSLPTPAAWPLPTALGGATGDLVLGVPEWLAGGAASGGFYAAAAVVFAGLTAGLLVAACGDRFLAPPSRPPARPAAPRRNRAEEASRTKFGRPEGGLALVAGALQHWSLATTGHFKRRRQARLAAASAETQRAADRIEPGLSRREPRFALRATEASRQSPAYDDGEPDAEWAADKPEAAPPPAAVRRPPTLRIPESWRFGRRAAEERAAADARARREGFAEVDADETESDGLDDLADLAEGAAFDLAEAEGLDVAFDASEPQTAGAAASRRPLPPLRAGKQGRDKARPRKAAMFRLPSLNLLAPPPQRRRDPTLDEASLEQNARLLEGVLDDFGVRGEIINVRPGPVVTLYELEPAPGIKSSRVISLADDIARSMSAIAARVAVVPGRNVIGIELPNASRETVFLREQVACKDFEGSKARLALALGKTIGGEPVIADLAKMPHLLVAGTTGSGKSVAINTMILSLVYRLTPEQCRLIMIDPKMLELSIYDGIPHLLTPVVTDPKKAVVALKWTVREMEDRYRKMSKIGVRNIDGYNQRVSQALAGGETLSRTVQTGFDDDTGEPVFETEELDLQPMPYIVVIIDEMADLMMVAGKEIEGAVQRLAQMARAAGIHVVMATQRPSVDVITGTIKANFPTRISFQVTSKIDSRTILGEQGAEQLLGQGDMLYMAGGGRIQRVHGPFVSDGEVEAIVGHLKAQGAPDYLEAITVDDDEEGGGAEGAASLLEESGDLYDQAVAVVLRDRKASTSYIQRRLAIGYNRAASLIEKMEKEGIVGSANHAGKREILVGENAA